MKGSTMNAKDKQDVTLWSKLKPHLELIAACLCGVLIIIGWILSKNGAESYSTYVYVLAFIIGGMAKAREGILDTIETKKLNVEILMILAALGSAPYWILDRGSHPYLYLFFKRGSRNIYDEQKSQGNLRFNGSTTGRSHSSRS